MIRMAILAMLATFFLAAGAMAKPPCPMGTTGGMMGKEAMKKHYAMYYERLATELDLTDEQRDKLEKLRLEYLKKTVKLSSDVKVAEIELRELLSAEPVNLDKVRAKLKDMEAVKTELKFFRLSMHEEFKKILTPAQLKKLRKSMHMMPMMKEMEEKEEGHD